LLSGHLLISAIISLVSIVKGSLIYPISYHEIDGNNVTRTRKIMILGGYGGFVFSRTKEYVIPSQGDDRGSFDEHSAQIEGAPSKSKGALINTSTSKPEADERTQLLGQKNPTTNDTVFSHLRSAQMPPYDQPRSTLCYSIISVSLWTVACYFLF